MLRRILFLVAFLFVLFVFYRLVDKQGSEELLDKVRNFSFSDIGFSGINFSSSQKLNNQEKIGDVEIIDLTQNIDTVSTNPSSSTKKNQSTTPSSSTTPSVNTKTSTKTSPTKQTPFSTTNNSGFTVTNSQKNISSSIRYQTKTTTSCIQQSNLVCQDTQQPTDKQILERFMNNVEN